MKNRKRSGTMNVNEIKKFHYIKIINFILSLKCVLFFY